MEWFLHLRTAGSERCVHVMQFQEWKMFFIFWRNAVGMSPLDRQIPVFRVTS